jgi:hypothetical protein
LLAGLAVLDASVDGDEVVLVGSDVADLAGAGMLQEPVAHTVRTPAPAVRVVAQKIAVQKPAIQKTVAQQQVPVVANVPPTKIKPNDLKGFFGELQGV